MNKETRIRIHDSSHNNDNIQLYIVQCVCQRIQLTMSIDYTNLSYKSIIAYFDTLLRWKIGANMV